MSKQGKVIHVKLNAEDTEKLEWLARLSRRPETDVMRLLIRDAVIQQLGVLEDVTCPGVGSAPGADAI